MGGLRAPPIFALIATLNFVYIVDISLYIFQIAILRLLNYSISTMYVSVVTNSLSTVLFVQILQLLVLPPVPS